MSSFNPDDDPNFDSENDSDGHPAGRNDRTPHFETEPKRAGMLNHFLLGRDRQLPVAILIGWLALLAYLALLPRTPRVPVISDSLASPIAHLITSAVLAAFLYWIFTARATDRKGHILWAVVSAGLASGAGIALEIAQGEYSSVRIFESSDIYSNVVGALFSVVLLVTLRDLGFSRRVLVTATVAMVGLITGALIASVVLWNPAYPYRGDHWHAQYQISICGERAQAMGGFPGGIHTHGSNIIHLHPRTADEEGANATLGLFFERAFGELSSDSLLLPSGERYSNGDACADGSVGELAVWDFDPAAGERVSKIDDPAVHVPRDLQTILIEFGEVVGAR
jgi:hypothetical protein